MSKLYVGIDNGLSGAVAMLFDDGVDLRKMPVLEAGKQRIIDVVLVKQWIVDAKLVCSDGLHITFELSQVMPINGSRTHFTQGFCYGALSTLFRISGWPATAVRPKEWMKEMHLGIRAAGQDTKSASLEACRRLYPTVSLLPTPRCTKDDDGMAEALLMATWAKRHNL